ncbi:hypothetical protein Tco_1075146 [Tanacetum coccineum]
MSYKGYIYPKPRTYTIDHVPSVEEIESFETDESVATPPPAYCTTSRMSVRTQTPIPFPSKAEVARLLALPTLPPSPLTPLSSPLPHIPSPPLPLPLPPTHTSPTNFELPLGYRAVGIRLRAASPLPIPTPSTSRRADILKADIPPRKRLCLTAPTPRFEVGESFAAAAKQSGSNIARRVDYSFVDTMDANIRASKRRTMATIEGDGYCNGGNLPGAYIIVSQLHYQDYEWYEALEDCKLKDKALRNKAIMEGSIKEDDESRYEQKRQWNTYTNYDDAYETNLEHNKSEELCEIQEQPVCNIRRYMMIKYSFNDDEEYVAVKEDEYDDLTVTRKEACRAYQEIFQIMDEGWKVTRTK